MYISLMPYENESCFNFIVFLAYWIGVWIYRVVTFPTLNEIYTDFLTNWTDTCICCYFISTTAILLYYAWKGSSANGNAPAVCYILQILYEICHGYINRSVPYHPPKCETCSIQKLNIFFFHL